MAAEVTPRHAAVLARVTAALAAAPNVPALKAIVDEMCDETTPLAMARDVMCTLAERLNSCEDNNAVIAVAEYALGRIPSRGGGGAMDDADLQLRLPLFAVHCADGDDLRAATVLAAAKLDSPAIDDRTRATAWIKAAQAFSRADDEVSADRCLKRASEVVARVDDAGLRLQHRAQSALVLDSRRKFIEAALRYLDVLSVGESVVDEEELVLFLGKAATCAILAPAGPQRTRVMGTLLRNERVEQIDPTVLSLLRRMSAERIIAPAESAKFEAGLVPHQRVRTVDGSTVVAKAIIEHNVLAAGRLYRSLSLSSLGKILGCDAAKAEKVVAKMISERRLAGSIDQVAGFLDYAQTAAPPPPTVPTAAAAAAPSSSTAAGAGAAAATGSAAAAGKPAAAAPAAASSAPKNTSGGAVGTVSDPVVDALLRWDTTLKDVCAAVGAASDAIGKKYPHLLPQ